jgi:hypothetical protein
MLPYINETSASTSSNAVPPKRLLPGLPVNLLSAPVLCAKQVLSLS